MKLKKYLSVLTGLFLVVGCKSQSSPTSVNFDEDRLIRNIESISHDSLGGRFFGTQGNYKASAFVARQFENLGIEPAYTSGYNQEFTVTFKGKNRHEIYPVSHRGLDFKIVPDTTVFGRNVVAMIKGETEKTIVITAHLDHLGVRNGKIFNGADDNASGSAALITIAEYFKGLSPKHNLIFAAVDAEEIGSYGAEYLLDHFPGEIENIVMNINMDMISRNDNMQLYASGLYHYPGLKEPLVAISNEEIELLFGHDQPGNETQQDWTFSSDHRVFHKRKIPFIYFGVEDHQDYHQSTDEFQNIDRQFYIEAVRLIISAIQEYDEFLFNNAKELEND